MQFYCPTTSGLLLFTAPIGRSVEEFLLESEHHGWPSFRDEEVVWDNVRCLQDGECVTKTGVHLGHNLPTRAPPGPAVQVWRNRYCINLVSVSGIPPGGGS